MATAAAATPATVTGTTTALSVLGADDAGESNLTYAWATTGTPPAAVSFSANGSNAAKNSTATFSKAGSYTFQVTITDAGGLTATSSVSVTVNQTLTSIVVTPAAPSLASHATQQFTAAGFDQFGSAMSLGTTTWSTTAGSITSGGLFTAPYASASVTVTATSGSVSGTTVATVTDGAPTVATAAAAAPATVTGTTTALSVLGADDAGESNLTYSWATTGTPPAAVSFSANGSNAAKNTTATFSKAGNYTFQVTITDDGGLSTTSSVTVTVSQTLTSITVTPATPALASHATQQFTASGLDQFGSAMSLGTTTWTATAGSITSGGLFTAPYASASVTVKATSGSVNGTTVATVTNAAPTVATAAAATPATVTGTTTALSVLGADDAGEANLTYTWATTGTPPAAVSFSANGSNAAKNATATFSKAGSYTFQVTITDDGGLSTTSSVSVTVSQTLASIVVTPASATLSGNQTEQFSASGYDQFGNLLASQPTFTWTSSGAGSINASGLYTAPAGSGSATITATSGAVSNGAAVTVTGTGTAPTVAIPAAATPATVTVTTTALSVLGADDAGESNLTYSWATTGTPPAAVSFSANGSNAAKNTTATFSKAGSYTFQVTIADDGGLSTTSSVSVTVNQTLTSITVTPASPALASHATQQFTAAGFDQFGSAMSLGTTTWSATAGSITSGGLFTAPYASAAVTVTATSGSVSGTTVATVTNAAPTVATAAAATPATVTGTTTALSVLGADDAGEANLTYSWATTGTPPAAVSFSANNSNAAKNTTATFSKAGSYTFQVTIADAGGLSTTSSVSVTVNQTLASIVVTPLTAALIANQTQQFSASGYDQFGSVLASQPAFTWAATPGVGSINASGLYTAPATAGSATITASSGSTSGSSSVSITASSPVTLGPSSLPAGTVNVAYNQTLTASGGTGTLTLAVTKIQGAIAGLVVPASGSYLLGITGTPTAAGTETFTVTATDTLGVTTSTNYSITVAPATTPVVPTIADGSFEQPVVAANTYQLDPTGIPWQFSGIAGVSSNGSPFTAGNPNAPNGSQVALIKGTGSMSQSVNLAAGTYGLSFLAAQRANYQSQSQQLQVLVDGTQVALLTPVGTSYGLYQTSNFTVMAGTHTIQFIGTNPQGGDNTAFLDEVAISAASPISDGSFEQPAAAAATYQLDPSGTPWQFSGIAGVSSNGSPFTAGNPNAPNGTQVALIKGTGSMSQSASLAAGTYSLSFLAAQRANYQSRSQQIQVLVDGAQVALITPVSTSYGLYETSNFTVTAGTHKIQFIGTNPQGGDNTAFLDEVAISAANPVSDGSFEQPVAAAATYQLDPSGTAWQFSGIAGVSSNGSPFTAGNPNAPDGTQVALIKGTGSMSQSVNLTAGTYSLSILAAQRANYQAQYQSIEILVDGSEVGTVTPSSTNYALYVTSQFTVTAGIHTIQLVGLNPLGGDNTAFIDELHF